MRQQEGQGFRRSSVMYTKPFMGTFTFLHDTNVCWSPGHCVLEHSFLENGSMCYTLTFALEDYKTR